MAELSPKQRDLEREIGAAYAGAFDRLYLLDAGADLDRARFEAGDLFLVPPGRTFAKFRKLRPQPASASSSTVTGKREAEPDPSCPRKCEQFL